MGADLRREFGVGLDGRRDRGAPRVVQFAVGERGELFAGGLHAASPRWLISASRPRTRRELSVPTGQPTIAAASLYE